MKLFGIELEFTEAIFNDIHKCLLNTVLIHKYKKSNNKSEQVRSDGSCWHLKYEISTSEYDERNRRIGGELASPAMEPTIENFDEIQKCINIINYNNPIYNKHTGMHIHINFNHIDRLKFLLTWFYYENILYNIYPERINNLYAKFLYSYKNKNDVNKPISKKLKETINKNNIEGSRNNNLYFYKRNNVNFLEIRMPQMTSDVNLQTAVIKICLQMVQYTKDNDNIKDSIDFINNTFPYSLKKLEESIILNNIKLNENEWKSITDKLNTQ